MYNILQWYDSWKNEARSTEYGILNMYISTPTYM